MTRTTAPRFFLAKKLLPVNGARAFAPLDVPPDPPVLMIRVARGLVLGSYDTGQAAPVTGSAGRKRFDSFGDAQMMAVRIEQTGASAATNIFACELEVRPYDPDSELA